MLGESEVAAGEVVVKDLRSGEQTTVTQDEAGALAHFTGLRGRTAWKCTRTENDQVDAVKRFFAENGKALAVGVILGGADGLALLEQPSG